MKFQLILCLSVLFAFLATTNAGTPSYESSWGPSWSPSWLEHCQQACMVCGPVPFDPLCDCQEIFGVKCSPPFVPSPSFETVSSSAETSPESVTEGP